MVKQKFGLITSLVLANPSFIRSMMLQPLVLSRLEKMILKSSLPFFTCADWISVKPPNTTVENLNSREIVTNFHALKNSAIAKLALWVQVDVRTILLSLLLNLKLLLLPLKNPNQEVVS